MKSDNLPGERFEEDQISVREQQQTREKVRWFLTCFAILFPILAFIGFLLTNNIAVLVGGTILSVPVYRVFAYYFPQQESVRLRQ